MAGAGSSGAWTPCVGIDLGGTHAVVAVCHRGKVDVIADESGIRTTPCVVGYLDGQTVVGDDAKDLPAGSTFYDAKRLLGRSLAEAEEQAALERWSFEVVEEDGVLKMKLPDRDGVVGEALTPQKVSSKVLESLKVAAGVFLSQPVSKAVISVPSHFSEAQRAALKEAGALAGLEVVLLLDEGEAALAAYGLPASRTAIVLHIGGRTTHAFLREKQSPSGGRTFHRHDDNLGGVDFDQRLLDFMVAEIRAKHAVEEVDAESAVILRRQCEHVKRRLSTVAEVPVAVYLPGLRLRYTTVVTRASFESLCVDLFPRVLRLVTAVLLDAGLERSDVDDIVLEGGSTRIPKV